MKLFSQLVACLSLSIVALAQADKVRMIDEFHDVPCDEYLARIDNALIEASNEPNTTVFVIIYEGQENVFSKDKKMSLPPAKGQFEERIKSVKERLAFRQFPVDRFRFVNGGAREKLTVEMWLLPPGADPPKPKPTPVKWKYRKGKPIGFCLECC
jgi:hypothetical protein